MLKYKSVFIDVTSQNWILEILGDDICKGLDNLGYSCRKGQYDDYNGEDISFHMWWIEAEPHPEAKINAVFVTHTDDAYKEFKLKKMKDEFDLFFCMSPEDGQFLVELGFDKSKVFGLNLPVRNTYIRPLTVGIFSRCYPDNRKKEEWLLNFCKSNPNSKLVDFVFIGAGWGEFVSKLSSMGCSYQWHNVSRDLPFEYMYQQLKMTNLDYYVYMGMDGGAMGSYDAYAMGATLCISDDGYHKGIPDLDYPFSTEEEFCKQLGEIVDRQRRKLDFFSKNSVTSYVSNVAHVLEQGNYPDGLEQKPLPYSVKNKRRSHYFKRGGFKRIKNFILFYLSRSS